MRPLDWLTERPIAHRGLHDGNKAVWENTPTAFSRAIAGGFSIECDVHLTRDGVPVVFHDEDLARLTGQPGKVHDVMAADMTALSVGGTGDRVPTMQSMLDLVAGRVPLVIELKGIEGKDDGLVASVGRLLQAYKGPAAIMSFDHHLLRRFSRDAPECIGGLTAEGLKGADLEAHFSMLGHNIAFVSYNVHHLPNPFVSFVRQRLHMPVITWTVRSPDELAKTHAHADQATFELFNPDTLLE